MKILNLYAGIGGNRKLWGSEHDITAVEINVKIAGQYKNNFPDDKVIIADAHEFLRANFRDFDFIWSSPPCPTHSTLQMFRYHEKDLKYPDMTLYQEIILLKNFFKGDWIVENVRPYYKSLIPPDFVLGRHFFWSNKIIAEADFKENKAYMRKKDELNTLKKEYGLDGNRLMLRNCVKPEIGKYIFDKIFK